MRGSECSYTFVILVGVLNDGIHEVGNASLLTLLEKTGTKCVSSETTRNTGNTTHNGMSVTVRPHTMLVTKHATYS